MLFNMPSQYTCLAAKRSTASKWIQAEATVISFENMLQMPDNWGNQYLLANIVRNVEGLQDR